MPTRRLTLPAVAALALACVVLGVLAALADGRDRAPARPAPQPARVTTSTLRVTAAPARPAIRRLVATPVPPAVVSFTRSACPFALPVPVAKAPAAEPVPPDLLAPFAILRRAATPDDALPKEALAVLRGRGLEPFDPAAARLLRKTADGGRAWVVPVRDVPAASPGGRCSIVVAPAPVVAIPKSGRPKGRHVLRVPMLVPVPARPAVPGAAPQATPATPHPGLAVVALGGAPVGAGGRLQDLVRGREAVAIDPCGGPDHDMLTVSGLVPDGVAAAFLTSPDGTAIRADVTDNAYTFVVPRAKTILQRYVVWTGGDGTPHVQPITAPPFLVAGRQTCGRPATTVRYAPSVSPDPLSPVLGGGPLGPGIAVVTPPARPAPAPAPRPRRHK